MTDLPTILSRKAIAKIFDGLTPTAWEKLFEREDLNGLGKLRREGDLAGRAYYETIGIIQWLIRQGHYTPQQTRMKADSAYRPSLSIRTHILA